MSIRFPRAAIFVGIVLVVSGVIPECSTAKDALPTLRDCAATEGCPELVVVPASHGPVSIGSPAEEEGRIDNEAQTQVEIAAFAIGKFEVSVGEYLQCVVDKACPEPEWRDPNSPHNIMNGSGLYYRNLGAAVTDSDRPITGVSFGDATAYAQWLSRKTGMSYRLPSEAEWEYVARAGTVSAYWWGDEPTGPGGMPMAHCRGCQSGFDGKGAAPVNSLKPNPWGLYNMLGNVWEWAADFYCDDNSARPKNGAARLADDCEIKDANDLHALRGGSTFYGPEKARSASRLRNFATFRNSSIGFRVARSLEGGK